MSVMRASRKPCSSKISLAASTKRVRVRADLDGRGGALVLPPSAATLAALAVTVARRLAIRTRGAARSGGQREPGQGVVKHACALGVEREVAGDRAALGRGLFVRPGHVRD